MIPANVNIKPLGKLSMHSSNPISASGSTVNVGNRLGQHFVVNRSLTHRPTTPGAISAISHPQHATRSAGANAPPGQGFKDRQAPFGRIPSSLNMEAASLVADSSSSKSRIRRFASANSEAIGLFIPTISPASIQACLCQR